MYIFPLYPISRSYQLYKLQYIIYMYIHCIQHVEWSIPFAASINHKPGYEKTDHETAARDTVLPNPALSRTSGHQDS